MPHSADLSPIEDVIEDARNGRMFILVDDESRENEGDLIIPAQMATPDAINFMAKYGRGLICLSMERQRVEQLGLSLMSRSNGTRHQTAFTVSIEAKEGVTTGISASDRARTVAVAIDARKTAQDIVTPGHVFPLVAKDGGVLVRAGHTEAAVDVARLAGVYPSGVSCEIMNDDGTMARMPDLIPFAKEHKLKIATIADLISYRRKYEKLVKRELESTFASTYGGDFKLYVYINTLEYAEHIVLVKGDITPDENILVRMHVAHVLNDALGDTQDNKQNELHRSMEMIAEAGKGVIVLLREPKKDSLSDILRKRSGEEMPPKNNIRDYGIGAQILLDLGVKNMELLTNSKPWVVGLEGYGLKVRGHRPIV